MEWRIDKGVIELVKEEGVWMSWEELGGGYEGGGNEGKGDGLKGVGDGKEVGEDVGVEGLVEGCWRGKR